MINIRHFAIRKGGVETRRMGLINSWDRSGSYSLSLIQIAIFHKQVIRNYLGTGICSAKSAASFGSTVWYYYQTIAANLSTFGFRLSGLCFFYYSSLDITPG